MTKKAYMKPVMKVVKIQHKCQILAGSLDPNGMNKNLQSQKVSSAWSRGNRDWVDDDE